MANYKARDSGLTQMLEKHTATGVEASFTHTPSTAYASTKYSEIQVIIRGESTLALILQMELNGVTDFDHWWHLVDVSTGTYGTTNTAGEIPILPTALIDGANVGFLVKISIFPSALSKINCHFTGHAMHEGFYEGWANENANGDISEIKIQCSTSTWKTGTEITVYGILK